MNDQVSYAKAYNDTLLQNIRIKCVEHGTSIPKVEKALGYGNGSISGWTKAKRMVPMDRVEAIAAHFECEVEDLTGADKKKNPAPANGDEERRAEFNQILEVLGPAEREQLLAFGRALVIAHEAQDAGPKSP